MQTVFEATCSLMRDLACRTQALVLSPTRELATQTDKTVRALGEFLKLKSHCCIGGKSIGKLNT